MRIFTCSSCGHTTYFHNVQCVRCGHRLGFAPGALALLTLEPAGRDRWRALNQGADQGAAPAGEYRLCANYTEHAACNWLVPAAFEGRHCLACRLNRTIPDLSVHRNRSLWRALQTQKNRLVYGLLRLGLPVQSRQEVPGGMAFDFLADPNPSFREPGSVVTGHAQGVITLDIAEADDAQRERLRQQMSEPYRTILGHFRHESGHYYWDRLVRDSPWLDAFRERFGDEREDYQAALGRHYADGPPLSWQGRFVSAYASSHPWEDWAESWAHYLHMVDTLETAWELGLRLAPREDHRMPSADVSFDPAAADFRQLIDHWLPLTVALNSLNHSMGQGDAYPFVLAPPAVDKLSLVHDIVRATADDDTGARGTAARNTAGPGEGAPSGEGV